MIQGTQDMTSAMQRAQESRRQSRGLGLDEKERRTGRLDDAHLSTATLVICLCDLAPVS